MEFIFETGEIVLRSIFVSGLATVLASAWSLPLAFLLLISESRIGRILQDIFNSLVSIPTVVLGLLLYLVFSRSGPLGVFSLLYTPCIISIGQAVLITPLMISFLTSSLGKVKETVWETAVALGASKFQASITVLKEGYVQLVRSILVGFNRAIGELGVALMVGGNIRGYTRVMTTAIALEVSKGNFDLAITLGVMLLITTLAITVIVRFLGAR